MGFILLIIDRGFFQCFAKKHRSVKLHFYICFFHTSGGMERGKVVGGRGVLIEFLLDHILCPMFAGNWS